MKTYMFGLDIGGTNIRSGFIDSTGALVDFERVDSKDILILDEESPNKNGTVGNVNKYESSLNSLCQYIRQRIKKNGVSPKCISAGFPSTVDKNHRILHSTPNLPQLNNAPVADFIEKNLKIPCVINKDTNLLLIHDVNHLNLPTHNTMIVGIYFGTGIGNSIMINGELWEGKNGVAGELGHIPFPGFYEICGCGNIGCSESIVGGKQLEKISKANFPTMPVKDFFENSHGAAYVDNLIDNIACTICAEINILDPHYVIISGGLSEMKKFPRTKLLNAIYSRTRKPYPLQGLRVMFPDDGGALEKGSAGVIGAGRYAFSIM